jgi:hypothetical protein
MCRKQKSVKLRSLLRSWLPPLKIPIRSNTHSRSKMENHKARLLCWSRQTRIISNRYTGTHTQAPITRPRNIQSLESISLFPVYSSPVHVEKTPPILQMQHRPRCQMTLSTNYSDLRRSRLHTSSSPHAHSNRDTCQQRHLGKPGSCHQSGPRTILSMPPTPTQYRYHGKKAIKASEMNRKLRREKSQHLQASASTGD